MQDDLTSVLMGFYFYPRGGSAHAARAIANELDGQGLEITLLAGSRSDLGEEAGSEHFFDRDDLITVDFAPALEADDPVSFEDGLGNAPMHASYEDRDGALDEVFASLDDETYEIQVAAWTRELEAAGAAEADLLYLHHLTPINEAAARAAPDVPVVGHIHGSELLMLERIAHGEPSGWEHAEKWFERCFEWAARCERVIVNSPLGRDRAVALLELDPARVELVPNGFAPAFRPMEIDRRSHWRRHLVQEPRGWRAGEDAGSVGYAEADLDALDGPTLLYSGRFTGIKRLPLLIEAFAAARERFSTRAALVLLGGYPGEWEGEHPAETIERLRVEDVFLAGWHGHDELPGFLNAADVMVHASVLEQFGQVIVEAMACGVPAIAVARGGPATIVDDGVTGWLIPPDDREALAAAMVEAVNDPEARADRGRRAREAALERYTWGQIGRRLAEVVEDVVAEASPREAAKLPVPG